MADKPNFDNRHPSPGVDAMFPAPGVDAMFPAPGVDARFPDPATDAWFPASGVDNRFTPEGDSGWYDYTVTRPVLSGLTATGGAGTLDVSVVTSLGGLAMVLSVTPTDPQVTVTISAGSATEGVNTFAQITELSAGTYTVTVTQGPATPVSATVTVSAAEVATPLVLARTFPVDALYLSGSKTFTTNYDAANYRHTGGVVYVSTGGNDTTGTGLSGAPYATLAKAITEASTGDIIDVAPGRYAPAGVVNNKNLTFRCTTGVAFVGDFLAEADITWSLVSGAYRATAAAAPSGMVDTTATAEGYPTVAVSVLNGTEAGGLVAAGTASVVRSTTFPYSNFRAKDDRDIRGEADSTVLIVPDGYSTALALTGTSQVFSEGIYWCGGADITPVVECTNTARLVIEGENHDGGILGGSSVDHAGDSSHIFHKCVVRGGTGDVIDIQDNVAGVQIDCVLDGGGRAINDNVLTGHGNPNRILTVNCKVGRYRSGSRIINSIDQTYHAIFGGTIQSGLFEDKMALVVGWRGNTSAATCDIAGTTFEGTGTNIVVEDGAACTVLTFDDVMALAGLSTTTVGTGALTESATIPT